MRMARIVLLVSMLAAPPLFASDGIRLTKLDAPVSDESLTPHLSSSAQGVYLSWLERSGEGHELRFSRWDGERFGPPRTIHRSEHFFANWADFASVVPVTAPGGERLAAHWLEKSGDGSYEYDVFVSISEDGGINWSPPERPHRDGTLSEHGFVSMVPRKTGELSLVWLDGRKLADEAAPDEMTLRFTTLAPDGSFQDEVLLDQRVCECCQTGMAATSEGLFVAYRDRSPDEIRDIAFVRYGSGEWSRPARLHPDEWYLTGCPVNGPQVAARGNRLAVAWFTASSGEPRVRVIFSEDGGRSFGEPIRVDGGNPVGRVDIELGGDEALVSWIERIEGRKGEVRVRRVDRSGGSKPSFTVARTSSGRASGFPRLTSFDGAFYLAWTEASSRTGPSKVRLARLVLE